MNIYQKLADATAEMEVVAKNLKIEAGRNSYKAVSERDVIDAVKKIEKKHGIFSYPAGRRVLSSDALESEGYDGKKKTTFFIRLEVVYRFVNVEDPSDFVEVISYGDGMDSGDKGPGKAMTYADKYALMKAYKISTGDDPDQEASVEARYTRRTAQPARDYLAELTAFMKENGISEEWLSGKFKVGSIGEISKEDVARTMQHKEKMLEAFRNEKGGDK